MIEIRITGETPQDALAQITALVRSASPEIEAQPAAPKPEKPVKTAEPEPPVTATVEEPQTEENTTPPPPAVPTKATTYALEDVRAKGRAAARAHGQPAIKALLGEFGVGSISNMAPEQYAAFIERLEGLGEKNA